MVDPDGTLWWGPAGAVVTYGASGVARPFPTRWLWFTWLDLAAPGSVLFEVEDWVGLPFDGEPLPLAPDTTGSDHEGLPISECRPDGPLEAFHSMRCGGDGIWLQDIGHADWGNSDPKPCPPIPAVCPDGLVVCGTCEGLMRSLELAAIEGDGVRNSFESKAEAACAALERGEPEVFANVLCAFKNELAALEGKKVSPDTAWDLRACIGELVAAEKVVLPCEGK